MTPRKPLEERRRATRISPEGRRLFLEAIGAGWSAERAAEIAGVSKQRFYERRLQDPDFAKAWQDAYDAATEMLRDELRRRSMEGYTETVLDADGNVIRRTERMNPADLHLELKRRDPAYKESAQISIGAGGPPDPDVVAAVDRFTEQVAALVERQQMLELSSGSSAAIEGEWRALPGNANENGGEW